MDIGANEGYLAALITEKSSLSSILLRDYTASVSDSIREIGLLPFDRVMVLVPDVIDLLPLLWALLKEQVTCILADCEDEGTAAMEIAQLHQVRYMIKKECSSPGMQSPEPFIFEPVALADPLNGRVSDTTFIPYIFYDRTAGPRHPRTISNKSLMGFFDRLDKVLEPMGDSRLLLSVSIPYSRKVMELIWASSRSIPVVLASLSDDNDLSRYIDYADRFEMDFGLFHFGSYTESSGMDKYSLLFDTVQFADKHGFSSVWTPERHFNEFGGLFPNPSVLSAAIAVNTSHVQIRSGSLVSPLHHAVRIAEDWSLVDNLSKGRVAISFASGWQCDDFIFFPENYPQRHEYMMEQVEKVRCLWRGEKVLYKNGMNREIEVGIFPRPVQKELPVWITVSGRKDTFIDAGRIGANILTHLLWQDTDELIEKIALYRQSLQDNGFDPRSGKVSVMVHTYLGKNNEDVKEKVREPLKNYIRTSTQLIQSMVKSNMASSHAKEIGGRYGSLDNDIPSDLMEELLEIAFNRFFEQAGLLGTIDKAKSLMVKLKSYDVDEIAALIDFGLGREDIMDGLTYLDELRALYDKKASSGHPVSFVHCSLDELENALPGSNIIELLNAQKAILVEAGQAENISHPLSGKINIISDSDNIRPLNDRRSLFTSFLSSEF